ncbi:MAG: bacillithiol system redox-active protein YtxJ [Flavobacteriales bacterium]|nr:bacillithiol system redox-active protein YtxJ [Flavobacteriales bacterium]
MAWIKLTEENQLEECWNLSHQKPQLIFKHSTRCNISVMALTRFQGSGILDAETVDSYYLDLLKFRNISNAIESKSGVRHQSPQVIVINKGEVFLSESHGMIDARSILREIKTLNS